MSDALGCIIDISKFLRRRKVEKPRREVIDFSDWTDEDMAPVLRSIRNWDPGTLPAFGFSAADMDRIWKLL